MQLVVCLDLPEKFDVLAKNNFDFGDRQFCSRWCWVCLSLDKGCSEVKVHGFHVVFVASLPYA